MLYIDSFNNKCKHLTRDQRNQIHSIFACWLDLTWLAPTPAPTKTTQELNRKPLLLVAIAKKKKERKQELVERPTQTTLAYRKQNELNRD